ncbi:Uncharacterised protein [Bordetella pertussis]|nr:Uncharacterised protein [Bordetella pertussis]
MPGRGGPAQQIGRPRRQVPGAIGAHHHHGGGAIGDQAAVAHRERVAYQARRQAFVHGQRGAHVGLGILLRPLPRRQRHGAQLLFLQSILGRVARRRQRVCPHRARQLVCPLVGRWTHRADQLARPAALVAAVRDERHVAQARLQRQGGVNRVGQEGRTAGAVVVGQARRDAEVLRETQARHEIVGQADEQAIDIGGRQAHAVERLHAGAHRQVQRRQTRRLADAIGGASHDRGLAARKALLDHCAALPWPMPASDGPAGSNTTSGSPASSRMMRARTAIPTCTSSGPMPSTRLIMRGPSSSSTRQTL